MSTADSGGATPGRHARPTAAEMEERAAAVLALFSGSDSLLDLQSIEEGAKPLGLSATQVGTLVNRLLVEGRLHVARMEGKRRLFAIGSAEPAMLKPVPFRDVVRHLELGDQLRFVGLRLDGEQLVVDLEKDGEVLSLSAA